MGAPSAMQLAFERATARMGSVKSPVPDKKCAWCAGAAPCVGHEICLTCLAYRTVRQMIDAEGLRDLSRLRESTCFACRKMGLWGGADICPTCVSDINSRAGRLRKERTVIGAHGPPLQRPSVPAPKAKKHKPAERKAIAPPPTSMEVRLHDRPAPPLPWHLRDKDVQFERPAVSAPAPARHPDTLKHEAEKAALETALAQVGFGTEPGALLFDDGRHRYVAAECSCRGTREECERCAGKGVYPRHELVDIGIATEPRSGGLKGRTGEPIGFSNDSRGGIYVIREQGRFLSNPHYEGDTDPP